MSRQEFFDLSWREFNWAVEGYYDDLKNRLGITEGRSMDKPTDEERRMTKEKTAHLWKRYRKN